jgi:hypothetical protein
MVQASVVIASWGHLSGFQNLTGVAAKLIDNPCLHLVIYFYLEKLAFSGIKI